MSHVQLESATQHEVVFAVPAHLKNGEKQRSDRLLRREL